MVIDELTNINPMQDPSKSKTFLMIANKTLVGLLLFPKQLQVIVLREYFIFRKSIVKIESKINEIRNICLRNKRMEKNVPSNNSIKITILPTMGAYFSGITSKSIIDLRKEWNE